MNVGMYEYRNRRETYIPAFLSTCIPVFFARSIIRLSKNCMINVYTENLLNKTGVWQTRDAFFLRKIAEKWDKVTIADKNEDLKQKKNF